MFVRFFRILSLSLIPLLPLAAQTKVTDIGPIEKTVANATVPVRVSASPQEIDNLAQLAFEAHGRYRRVTASPVYDIRFTAVSGNRVQVDVTRGTSPVVSNTVSGTSLRNALLRAADLAVEATGGGKGFFASKLAFVSEQSGHTEIYVGDLFFGDVKQRTADNALAMSPRWSPDGRKLLYTSFYKSNAADIFLIDFDSMQRSSFVSFRGTNQSGRFSPDGSKVAMVLSGEGNPEIYVANPNGRQVSRRTRTSGVESSPVFSPDGRQLLFTSDVAGGPQLYVMPVEGGRMTRLGTNISGYCAEPDWSTGDPTKIAFTMRIGKGYQIGLFDLKSGQAATQVSSAPQDAVEPVWLADGRHLLYTARVGSQRSIWILDTVTRKAMRLSPANLGQTFQASVVLP